MTGNAKTRPITIDLNQFKLHIALKNKIELTLHFNSPSRRFYLSLIALVVNEMKRQGKVTSIPLEGHQDLLALLNETVGGSAGLSEKEHLLPRIYRKWQHALPNLEEAPLFAVLGKKKGYEEGVGKAYHFTEVEKDIWANLFEYIGSEENVRLKFAVDRIGAGLDDVEIIYGDRLDADAWDRFLSSLKGGVETIPETEATPVVSEAPGLPVAVPEKKRTAWQGGRRSIALVTVVVVFMGAGTLAFWKLYLEPARLERASVERKDLPLSEKPSIAVLPFTNMSDDPQQEHFCDGISDDIITDLSKLSGLIVISRNSSFTYKGKAISAQQIGQDLNVRYLLEGSARRAGDRVRINAQLVDASTGQHLWAERYEGRTNDIFAVQDGITRKIVTALALKLTASEQEALADKGTENPLAYEEYLKGWENYLQYTNESFARARFHLEKAIELDPEFSRAQAALAVLYWKAVQTVGFKGGLGLTDPIKVMFASLKSRELLHKAMEKPTALSHGLMAQYYINMFMHNEALAEIEQAVEMDPNNPELHAWMSRILWLMGKDKEAIESAKRALRLDPNNPAGYLIAQAKACLPDGDLQESLSLLERARMLNPDVAGTVGLAQSVAYALQGSNEKARAAFEIFKKSKVCKNYSVRAVMGFAFAFMHHEKSERIAEALVKAGATGSPTDYCKASRSNLVKGPEIKNLLFGHKITGIDPATGERFSYDWDKNGESIFVQGAFRDKCKWWIEGDVLFGRFEKLTRGLLFTHVTFRNPGGTKEQMNQYFFVNHASGIFHFSRVD